MVTAALDITLVSARDAEPESGGSLILEQESWDPYTGHLTKMQIIGWLGLIIFNTAAPGSNCPPDGPGFEKFIYAFPYPQNLNYKIGCSHGSLGTRKIETIEFSELVQCNLSRTPQMQYPAVAITSYAFEGDCYSKDGDIVAAPSIRVRNNVLTLSTAVYASLRVSYLVERHVYRISIQPRQEYHDKKYQSFVYAVWPGGTNYLGVEDPVGAESEEQECNNIFDGNNNFTGLPKPGGTSIGGDLEVEGDEPYGPVSGEDEYVDIDYCSGEVS